MNDPSAIDASALVAIYAQEPGAAVEARLRQGGPFYVAAPTLVELRPVLAGRFGKDAVAESAALRKRIDFTVFSSPNPTPTPPSKRGRATARVTTRRP